MSSFAQGNVLPLATGTNITNAYNANTISDAKIGTFAKQIDVFFEFTTVGGSPIANVTVAIEVRYSANDSWMAVQSKRHDTGTSNTEHTFSLGAAPQGKTLLVTCTEARGALGGIRVKARGDAAGVSGDIIEANLSFS